MYVISNSENSNTPFQGLLEADESQHSLLTSCAQQRKVNIIIEELKCDMSLVSHQGPTLTFKSSANYRWWLHVSVCYSPFDSPY